VAIVTALPNEFAGVTTVTGNGVDLVRGRHEYDSDRLRGVPTATGKWSDVSELPS